MDKLKNRINDLLLEYIETNSCEDKDVAELLQTSPANISRWKNGISLPSIENLIKLTRLFDCSIDYACGRTENIGEFKPLKIKDFSINLHNVLHTKHITKYKLFKDLKLTKGHENAWFTNKKNPSTINYIKIADYLNISLEELID